MKDEKAKPGFFERFSLKNSGKKNSCCCNIELEEIPAEDAVKKTDKDEKKNSCCG